MNIVGIIAEYNPFHLGHAWHLAEARRRTGAAYVVVVMSGSHVQRGAPAMFDKYTRASAALSNGADLVLELPPCAATASAEYFAHGAVRLLAKTGVVTDLCFGSECADLPQLSRIAAVLTEEPEAYRALLQDALRQGRTFPEARARALCQYDRTLRGDLLDAPNNLLGVEYLKALIRLKSPLRVHAIPRTGASYHDWRLTPGAAASASAIRRALTESAGRFTPDILRQLPSAELYTDYYGRTPITEDACSLPLLERLMRNPDERFEDWFGVTTELSNRIRNHLEFFESFSQFTKLIKTRNRTQTSVSRALLHILLDIREYQPAEAFHVLGFRREAKTLLRALAARGALPLITRPADERLPQNWRYADRLHASVRSLLHGRPFGSERRRKLPVL